MQGLHASIAQLTLHNCSLRSQCCIGCTSKNCLWQSRYLFQLVSGLTMAKEPNLEFPCRFPDIPMVRPMVRHCQAFSSDICPELVEMSFQELSHA